MNGADFTGIPARVIDDTEEQLGLALLFPFINKGLSNPETKHGVRFP